MLLFSCVNEIIVINKGGVLLFRENEFKAELIRKGFTVNSLVEAMKSTGTTMNVATMYRKMNGASDFFERNSGYC